MTRNSILSPGHDCRISLPTIGMVFLCMNIMACSSAPEKKPGCTPGSSNLLSREIVHHYEVDNSGNVEHGNNLFISLCAGCHYEQGVKPINTVLKTQLNSPPPQLGCNEFYQDLSEAYLFATIKHGKTPNISAHSMPAWKGVLSDEEILDLVSYILDQAKQAE